MRGKVTLSFISCTSSRITPAYAGKRKSAVNCTIFRGDHPRLCGEKPLPALKFQKHLRITPAYAGKRLFQATLQNAMQGSPPPMRGKAAATPSSSPLIRITPAYAGKSGFSRITIRSIRGSPPPMRGKAAFPWQKVPLRRITPAYAGKRVCEACGNPRDWDHPRLCGEKTKKIPKQRYFFHQPASFSFSLQYT